MDGRYTDDGKLCVKGKLHEPWVGRAQMGARGRTWEAMGNLTMTTGRDMSSANCDLIGRNL